MRATLALVVALAAGPAAGEERAPGPVVWPECYCTDSRGRRVEMGAQICLTVGGRSFVALCAMSQNSPTWREVEEVREGCAPDPLSFLERLEEPEPELHACLVDPHVPLPVPRAGEEREG